MSQTIFLIGLAAQFFYTARALVQWIKSEKSKKIESPTIFWIFSLLGSSLFFFYGYLRDDFSIIFGELLSYYIYMWNLKAKGILTHIPKAITWVFAFVPVAILGLMLKDFSYFTSSFFKNEDLPIYAIVWGSVGQFIYKMRFVYQWYYSYRHKESLLPVTFWVLALVGSLMIIIYGIFRLDWIIIIGQTGIIATIRNIIIGRKFKKEKEINC